MLILQRRGRTSAAQLADELEVSERTILRDIDELSGAGVPVYIATLDAATAEVLSLSPHVEVLEPDALRNQVGERLRSAAALYQT